MPSTPTIEKIKAKRIQAEQNVKDLREAEIDAAFRETPIDDDAYLETCRFISKKRQLTQRIRHRVGRKRYSINVQLEKLAQLQAEQEQLISLLEKNEVALAKMEQDASERREVIYQALGE